MTNYEIRKFKKYFSDDTGCRPYVLCQKFHVLKDWRPGTLVTWEEGYDNGPCTPMHWSAPRIGVVLDMQFEEQWHGGRGGNAYFIIDILDGERGLQKLRVRCKLYGATPVDYDNCYHQGMEGFRKIPPEQARAEDEGYDNFFRQYGYLVGDDHPGAALATLPRKL